MLKIRDFYRGVKRFKFVAKRLGINWKVRLIFPTLFFFEVQFWKPQLVQFGTLIDVRALANVS